MTTFLSCFIRFSFVSLLSIAVDTRALHPCGQELLVDIAIATFDVLFSSRFPCKMGLVAP
jgi:hypothetical protein